MKTEKRQILVISSLALCVLTAALQSPLPAAGAEKFDKAAYDLEKVNFKALKLAARDLTKTYPQEYTQADQIPK